MKKICLIIILLLLVCSCEKKEYTAIEISSYDLYQAVIEKKGNFVFAIYNIDHEDSNDFLKDLKFAADRANTNIYYIDYKHSSNDTVSYLIYDLGYNSNNGQYVALFENGKISNSAYYSDFNSIYEVFFKFKSGANIKLTTEEQEEEYINKALELYDEGKYNSAVDTLNHAWPNKKAKSVYRDYKYMKLSGIWESYVFLDEEHTKVDFYAFYFLGANDDYCLFYNTKNKLYEGFEKPAYADLSHRYYHIKDDIIYMSSKDNGEYEPYYKIVFINDIELKLVDLKNKNKEIMFQRRD